MIRASRHADCYISATSFVLALSSIAATSGSIPPGTRASTRETEIVHGTGITLLSLARRGEQSAGFAGLESWAGSEQFLGRLETFEGKVDELTEKVVELSRVLWEASDLDLQEQHGGKAAFHGLGEMSVLAFLAASVLMLGVCMRTCLHAGRAHPGGTHNAEHVSAGFRRLREQYVWRKLGHVAGWCTPVPTEQMPWAPVVFVGHPTSLSSAFAMWLPSSNEGAKWKEAWWMGALAPFTFAYSLVWMHLSPIFCQPYLWVDHFLYGNVVCGVWLSRIWGWQFVARPETAHRNIKAILRAADQNKVQVLGLGSLNKAEFVNSSGERLVREMGPTTTRVVHGNTLTAAVVVENVVRIVSSHTCKATASSSPRMSGKPVCLTGPTSKVGRAVALQLVRRGFAVRCVTGSALRFEELSREAATLSPLAGCEMGSLEWADSLARGVDCSVWLVGKYDLRVRDHIPFGATAIVFAVPCPLTPGEGGGDSAMSGSRFRRHMRGDVRVVDGGLLKLDSAQCSAREFPILLPKDVVYACHAAAMVHFAKGWIHHEVGKVDLAHMQTVLDAAYGMGMTLPPLPPLVARVVAREKGQNQQRGQAALPGQGCVSCVVVGGGASGLAVAACLKQRGYDDVVVLEANNVIQGHWGAQYDELRITSRKAHCELPHYTIDEGGASVDGVAPGGAANHKCAAANHKCAAANHKCAAADDTISAQEFVSYLQRYAKRFRLDVRLGCRVTSARHIPANASAEVARAHLHENARGFWAVKYTCRTEVAREGHEHEVEGGGPCGVQAVTEKELFCCQLVDASGRHSRPYLPPLLLDRLRSFEGHILHSSQVTGLAKLAVQDVVIVGLGNSAADIAMSLLDHGAQRVRVCIRSMPSIVRRQWGPLSVEWVSLLALQHLPRALADFCVDGFVACFFGPRWWVKYAPPGTRSWMPYVSERVPVIDKWAGVRARGGLVQSIKDGRLVLVGPVTAAAGKNLCLSSEGEAGSSSAGQNGGCWAPCDVVICATGFSETTQDWLASGTVLADTLGRGRGDSTCSPFPLRVGFSHGAALLPLRQISKEAMAVAAIIGDEQ